MSTTAHQLRQNAEAARAALAAHTLPEEVAQVLAASQLNLDAAANLLDAKADGEAQLREDLRAVEIEQNESIGRAAWGRTW